MRQEWVISSAQNQPKLTHKNSNATKQVTTSNSRSSQTNGHPGYQYVRMKTIRNNWNQPISLCYDNQNLNPQISVTFHNHQTPRKLYWNNFVHKFVLLKRFCWKDVKLTSEPCRNGSMATNQMAPSNRECTMLHANAKPADSKRNGYYPLLHKNRASSIHTSLSLFLSKCHQKILIKFYVKCWYSCLLGSWLQSPCRIHMPGYLVVPLVPDS